MQSILTGNKGENVEGDNTGDVTMEKEKDEEKETEIADTKESWKDDFVHEKSSYYAVKISQRFGNKKIPAWCLNKDEDGKDKEEHNLVMMQMIGGFTYHVSKLNGGEKVVSSKGHNVFKYEEAVKLWSPAEIENEFVCNFVESKDRTVSV